MFEIFKQPYPSTEVTNRNIISSIITGLFISGFLKFFQPFGINNWQHPHKNFFIIIFGVITAIVMIFNFFIVKKNSPKWFHEGNYTVFRHILWSVYMIVSITAFNYIFSVTIGLVPNSIFFAGQMFFITSLVGLFPTVFFTFTDYLYHLKKYNIENLSVQKPLLSENEIRKEIILTAENEKDIFNINEDLLLYIESSDNYATITYLRDGVSNKFLLRSSLNRLEGQILNKNIIRCHRSFIVNLKAVNRISGNAQGYKLFLNEIESPVPVARKYSDLISEYFKKIINRLSQAPAKLPICLLFIPESGSISLFTF